MESFVPARLDIFEIYRRYCEIMSESYACGNEERHLDMELQNACGNEEHHLNMELQQGRHFRESLNQLLKLAGSRPWTRISVFEEIYKLMSRLDISAFLQANNAEFSSFYDFVFFICRENGQKSITVSRAVMAWRLVLAGRFPLLNDWCEYVEQNQRHNISEDTWRQVLAFSCCVRDNLEGYDPEGAWPILVDEFVQHLYRNRSYTNIINLFSKCGLLDGQQPLEVPPPGPSNMTVGVKRKFVDALEGQNGSVDDIGCYNNVTINKTRSQISCVDIHMYNEVHHHHHHHPCDANDSLEIAKQSSSSTLGSSLSPCHVEGCLSKGFDGLFSRRSRMRC